MSASCKMATTFSDVRSSNIDSTLDLFVSDIILNFLNKNTPTANTCFFDVSKFFKIKIKTLIKKIIA